MKKKQYYVGEEIFINPVWMYNNIAPITVNSQEIEEYKEELKNNFNIGE